jgi:hypothetical protein
MITGKCKQDFEKWFLSKTKTTYRESGKLRILKYDVFTTMSKSMQYGVLQDFFGSVGIDVVDDIDSCANDFRYLSKVDFKYIDAHNTRPEARDAAIEKANEIHNQR